MAFNVSGINHLSLPKISFLYTVCILFHLPPNHPLEIGLNTLSISVPYAVLYQGLPTIITIVTKRAGDDGVYF